MPGKVIVQGGTLGSGVGLAELEVPAADGAIIIGDGSGAPVEVAAFASSAGVLKIANGGTAATSAAAARTSLGADSLYGQSIDTRKRVYRPTGCQVAATFAMAAGTAYWHYIGYTTEAVTPKHIEMFQTVLGTVSQAAEVALASTPLAPNRASQSLTKIAANGSLDDLTANINTMKRNTTAMATSVPAGTHLWIGLRQDMGGTECTMTGASFDFGDGTLLTTAASGVLTDAGPWTGAIPTTIATPVAPFLIMVLD